MPRGLRKCLSAFLSAFCPGSLHCANRYMPMFWGLHLASCDRAQVASPHLSTFTCHSLVIALSALPLYLMVSFLSRAHCLSFTTVLFPVCCASLSATSFSVRSALAILLPPHDTNISYFRPDPRPSDHSCFRVLFLSSMLYSKLYRELG